MQCDELSLVLAEVAESGVLPLAVGRHVESCLRCQAELAQYRKIRRAMSQLVGEIVQPSDDLLSELLEAVRPPAEVHRLRPGRRRAYIAAAATAATAGAAGAIVLASRLARGSAVAS